MVSPMMPFANKPKKNVVFPIPEEQMQKIRNDLPSLEINRHKTSCELTENVPSGSQNITNPSHRNRSGTYDSPRGTKKTSKSPKKHKFSMDLSGARLDSFGYPILKGGRKHRVSFKEDLCKVIKVENWKSYNMDSTYEKKKCSCNQCIII